MRKSLDEKRSERLQQKLTGHYDLPVIDGFQLSYHAGIRMVARRIEIEDVREALRAPSRPNAPGTRKHCGEMAMVVVNVEKRTIVTVGYGTRNSNQRRAS